MKDSASTVVWAPAEAGLSRSVMLNYVVLGTIVNALTFMLFLALYALYHLPPLLTLISFLAIPLLLWKYATTGFVKRVGITDEGVILECPIRTLSLPWRDIAAVQGASTGRPARPIFRYRPKGSRRGLLYAQIALSPAQAAAVLSRMPRAS
jgi:hypothetical protein